MSRRTPLTIISALLALIVGLGAGSIAFAYVFPSTNEANRAAGLPHVNLVEQGPGTVTLEFVNPTTTLAFFEYRIDGVVDGTSPHPVIEGDVMYPGVCVDGRAVAACPAGPVVRTFTANSTVEVRLALGDERDWDFDWNTFTVGPLPQPGPVTKDDCKNGGWMNYGFPNQGQCIKSVK